MGIHATFDIVAALCAMAVTALVHRWRLKEYGDRISAAGRGYFIALLVGAVAGGYLFGTLNLWLGGIPAIGRSILGAFAGAILAIEIFKAMRGIRGSTGLLFVTAFATSVAVGRWGCFLSGIDDQTYGVETTLPWGRDFGDGVLRHPVQLYESAAMAAFLVFALTMLARRERFFMAYGFYLLAIWYGAQRFVWEFLKPYASVLGPLNVFHILSAILVMYGTWMIARGPKPA